ncbi:MAG: 1-acyl-sn-glycerol-3-phosphate acyltransferase [Acidobacteria bacterium]|nr:1-acyl-sn-glycerol-3-phosphate acyltransferase [Acidobacteriota bacterium]
MIERFVAWFLSFGLKLLTGAHGRWSGCAPVPVQRVYCVNHTSHLDFLLLWTALPGRMRRLTRPVAAADYWNAGPIRRYVINRVFHGVLVDRSGKSANPLEPVFDALAEGQSLIFFPEGTRGPGEGLLPFKSGIYHVARHAPNVDVVPVWIDNSYRVMPKGMFFPIPLLCSMTFGVPLRLLEQEDKDPFLTRLRSAMLELQPPQ